MNRFGAFLISSQRSCSFHLHSTFRFVPTQLFVSSQRIPSPDPLGASPVPNTGKVAIGNTQWAKNSDGHEVVSWHVVKTDQKITLGAATTASCFAADHISGSVGWKVESGGMSVVFSGDTRYNPELVEASKGARLLSHEALRTDEEGDYAKTRGHSTAGEAARAAAQAGVAELILTHLDSGYNDNPQPLLDDAKKHYSGPITAATDLHQIIVEG